MLRQSTVIFGSLLFAFVVYITMKGQLPAWLDLFKHGSTTAIGGTIPNIVNHYVEPPHPSFPYPVPQFSN